MPPIEHRLQQRWPHWFRGRRGAMARPLLRGMVRWSRLDAIDAFMEAHVHLRGLDFVTAALRFLGTGSHIAPDDLARIPARGRLVIVANHPSGALDALALLDAVGRVRSDVRIVANDVLAAIEPLSGLLLPVRVFGGRARADSLQAIEAALQREQCVIVFPSGEVSRWSLRGVRDGHWRRGCLHFARRTGAPVLPVRVVARNSALFYGASALFRPAGTALLVREMFARRGHPVQLHVGQPIRLPASGDARQQLREVRRALYRLGEAAPRVRMAPLPAPLPTPRLRLAIAATESIGTTSEGRQLRLARCTPGSPLLLEIGRLRERAFRSVGEGTGRARDIDRHDPDYEHLLAWDAAAGRIAGAYRIARCTQVLARRGVGGLYTATLFDYADAMHPRLARGVELGRSFVDPDYRGGRSLDLLWQGIGAYVRRHPELRYLYGAVSISAALPPQATVRIVDHYRRHHGTGAEVLAIARRPWCGAAPPACPGEDAAASFARLQRDLAAMGVVVPVLYRQYTALCEPGGVRFLAFGVDPDFCDSIDGLVEVDLQRLRLAKGARYLGPRPLPEMAA
ncbi:lysophospholipid acyltransferase family protein [Luteimonas kalidii]|uniref:L-ornithine N(alpha)-acyltransferase n=1 Tax=Luteimonas kalidii TaxID=3042025 RepID=A0ABT6JVM1_9GAMM|nr:lysophospholipid acyltransferase family protein [Luteimonas kalidii]MDH5834629.1 lysophospholipid acyltransferase family protein [Luteimonas kalidii]